jgi:hypothetical protein
MTVSNNILHRARLTDWLNNLHDHGGSVYCVNASWDILGSPEDHVYDLFYNFSLVPFESILEFAESDVYDNSMEYRDIMEDACKILYLVEQIQKNNLKFNPQIVHEPWHDRYRVHPGSGRLAAMWLMNINNVRCLYTHFNEPCFTVPPNSEQLYDVEGVLDTIFRSQNDRSYTIETYYAFPDNDVELQYTLERDSEWDPSHVITSSKWEFIRYSEGRDFRASKLAWRELSIYFWQLVKSGMNIGLRDFNINSR